MLDTNETKNEITKLDKVGNETERLVSMDNDNDSIDNNIDNIDDNDKNNIN